MSLQYQTSNAPSASTPNEAKAAGRVLLIDDSEELLKVLEAILLSRGFDVNAFHSAADGLACLAHSVPDIIVCDVMMPGMSGFEFQSEVQLHPDWCDIPFVFLTAMSGREAVVSAKENGCDDYLTKPFDPEELLAVVAGKLTLASHRKRMSVAKLDTYRRRIIHTLSHEFRTPLVSINTGTELLLDQFGRLEDQQMQHLLESIQRGGQRLERLVNDFMLLQQIDLGQAARSMERFRRKLSPAYLLQSAVSAFKEGENLPRDFVPENLELVLGEHEYPKIEVYDVQVLNVLERLLGNAVKFGGVSNKIVASVRVAYGRAGFVVRDHGPGMPPEAFAAACAPFSQIDREVNEQQGAGLGLTISRYLANLNGGTIHFRTPSEGTGLEVELMFPEA